MYEKKMFVIWVSNSKFHVILIVKDFIIVCIIFLVYDVTAQITHVKLVNL